MSRFLQLHLLTSYPPSNLNRDDLGQPKTALMGGVNRLRISSQSLKRAWRTSDVFRGMVKQDLAPHTRGLSDEAKKRFIEKGVSAETAEGWAKFFKVEYEVGRKKGKKNSKKEKLEETSTDGEKKGQIVHLSPSELAAFYRVVDEVILASTRPTDEQLDQLLGDQNSVDIAMFGRMLTAKKTANVSAAVQVAHAIGVHASPIEDDFFTVVDDLNHDADGAGLLNSAAFAAAVFYQYICVDREQLTKNLHGDTALAARALRALAEAALKVAPTGKQNSYASRAYAHFALVERGAQQPRSLALAFVRPVDGHNQAETAVDALLRTQKNMDHVYGACADSRAHFNVLTGEGSVAQVLDFVAAEA